MLLLLGFSFLAGIFTILSPCILPILPAILSIGTTQGKWRPLGVILGLIISFTFFTLTLTTLVHATGISANIFRYIAIALIFIFGLIMIIPKWSAWFAQSSSSLATVGSRFQSKTSSQGFWGGFIFGIALGLVWTPCAGPILAAITTLVAIQSVSLSTILLTLAYSLGAGIPMFLIAYGGSKLIQTSRFLSKHSEGIRQIFGGLMILTAIALALHWDMVLQQQITRFLPPILVEDSPVVKTELEKLRSENASPAVQSVLEATPDTFGNFGSSPEFVGIVNWINSPPLSLMQLKGKVVLIDFWTYSCINCLRTLPYIEKWYADYKDKGLVIIGVHTPEFEFEKDPMNVADAAARLGVLYPIAQDNDYRTWEAFRNRFWPAHYLIDQNGDLRMVHFGEGGYAETENAIRTLLGMPKIQITEKPSAHRIISPETYLGTLRGISYTQENIIKDGLTATYEYKKPLQLNKVGLKGQWKITPESITAVGDDSFLDLHFQAREVYLVLSGSSKIPAEAYLDGKHVDSITIDGDRKYDIVKAPYGEHQLSLKLPKGVSAYAFTFGDED